MVPESKIFFPPLANRTDPPLPKLVVYCTSYCVTSRVSKSIFSLAKGLSIVARAKHLNVFSPITTRTNNINCSKKTMIILVGEMGVGEVDVGKGWGVQGVEEVWLRRYR